MKTRIVFSTKHGCTEKCAQKIKNHLSGDTVVVNLKQNGNVDLSGFDTVIIGGSIHASRVQTRIIKFLNKNSEILLEKKLGLFLCCMEQGEKAVKQLNDAFPHVLRNHASACEILGGEFNFEKMNFIERFIVRKVAKTEKSVSRISDDKIERFAEKINSA